jgi:riboflavin biosynthesis pyrimidine reductase
MRALCDGILIGSGTLICDKPALTVRHVAGKNPQRIILGTAQKGDFESLKQSDSSEIWSIGSNDLSQEEGVSSYTLSSADAEPYTCNQLLEWLWEKGIHSVYVEGGAKTTSCFLREGMIDIMQLHFSPLVFGSGISAIQLPQIEAVSESISFDSFAFQLVGDSVMFVGTPIYNSGD